MIGTSDGNLYRATGWQFPQMLQLWPPDTPDFIWPPIIGPTTDEAMFNLVFLLKRLTDSGTPVRVPQ
jgi:hypothetical protein